jgi:hypothetical protein
MTLGDSKAHVLTKKINIAGTILRKPTALVSALRREKPARKKIKKQY